MPDRWQTSGQTLLNSVMHCVGKTLGAVAGGYWYSHGAMWGRRSGCGLYLLAAVVAGGVLVAHTLASCVLCLCGRPALLTPRGHRK